jgi:serine/threonine-protein kinase
MRVAGAGERAARRYRDAAVGAEALTEPPLASLAYGAAGVAYFLLRHARFGGGEPSLEAAAWWIARAEDARDLEGAYETPTGPLSAMPGGSSMHYAEPGIWWVAALVAAEVDDGPRFRNAAARFASAAARAAGQPGDVAWGSAGLLLGCADLITTPTNACILTPLRVTGDRLALDLADLAERDGAVSGETAIGFLGAAHGWAGVAHALLRWSSATAVAPPPAALALLDRLIALRRPSGRWPVRAGSREVRRGWCHGSAGWAQLWALAWQRTGDDRFLDLAEHAVADVVTADEDNASLCCGRAGEAYAALTLYGATGEERWLSAAHGLARDAARLADRDDTPPHRLFSGALGVALLETELEDPGHAAMPVYQAVA